MDENVESGRYRKNWDRERGRRGLVFEEERSKSLDFTKFIDCKRDVEDDEKDRKVTRQTFRDGAINLLNALQQEQLAVTQENYRRHGFNDTDKKRSKNFSLHNLRLQSGRKAVHPRIGSTDVCVNRKRRGASQVQLRRCH